MNEELRESLEKFHRQAVEELHAQPGATPRPEMIPYSELPADTSMNPIAKEWNFYRKQAGQLLANGHEGKWILIKNEKIVGIWDNEDAAYEVASREYPMQSVLIHQIRTEEPVLRGPSYLRLCRN